MVRKKSPHTLADDGPTATLRGCSIAFVDARRDLILKNHGELPQTVAELERAVAERGGNLVNKVVNKATHLVATADQYSKRPARIREAIDAAIPIVNYEWLIDSISPSADEPVDTTTYLLRIPGLSTPSVAAYPQTPSNYQTPGTGSPLITPTRSRNITTPSSAKRSINFSSPSQQSVKKARSGDKFIVPVDSEYKDPTCVVYKDESGVFFSAILNQTDTSKNANKAYHIQVLQLNDGRYICWTRWGRVGEKGQSRALGDGTIDTAIATFKKKFKDKSGNSWTNRDEPTTKADKYTMVELDYETEVDDMIDTERQAVVSPTRSRPRARPKSRLHPAVERLMNFIFDNEHIQAALSYMDYDLVKMPLGALSQATLRRGYQVLADLVNTITTDPENDEEIRTLSNTYYTTIPHAFRRSMVPPILSDMKLIKRECELIETLIDVQLGNEIMETAMKSPNNLPLVDRQFAGLGMAEMTPLDHQSSEFLELRTYLVNSAGSTHAISYEVEEIFRIERNGEVERFRNSEYGKLDPSKSSKLLLWHGSRSTNFGGILSAGLRIAPPSAPSNGFMFDKGIYFANMSTKSANYCHAQQSSNTGLLLLCVVELGKPALRLNRHDYSASINAKLAGCISVHGLGRTSPKAWKDCASLHPSLAGVMMPDVATAAPTTHHGRLDRVLMYDEYICYSVEQVTMKYLFRVEMNNRLGY